MLRFLGFYYALWGSLWVSAFTPPEDGLYAVFETTEGTFAVRLFHEDVGYTVANFVGLAEGSRAWLDVTTGVVRREPYYDGITFHRVIEGFVIQAGSPNGMGTDGPGYTLWDEIRTDRRHSAAGVLSMAKTGDPNSGGSQFFLTLRATSSLDGNHTVFGEVVEGLAIVQAIGAVPTGGDDRPLTPVVIEALQILRQGPAAEAFDVSAFALPVVDTLTATFSAQGPALNFTAEANGEGLFYFSEDLVDWTRANSTFPLGPQAVRWDLTGVMDNRERLFLRPSQLIQPPPLDRRGGELFLRLSESETITLRFDAEDPQVGTYRYDEAGTGTEGEIRFYEWRRLAAGYQVLVDYIGLLPMQLHLQTQTSSGPVEVRVLNSLVGGTDFTILGTFSIP